MRYIAGPATQSPHLSVQICISSPVSMHSNSDYLGATKPTCPLLTYPPFARSQLVRVLFSFSRSEFSVGAPAPAPSGTGVWGDTGIADACQLYYARNADRCTSRAALFLLFFGRVHRSRSEAVRGGWRSPVGLYALNGIQPNMRVQIT